MIEDFHVVDQFPRHVHSESDGDSDNHNIIEDDIAEEENEAVEEKMELSDVDVIEGYN
jgi:hypothetical protein